MKKTMRILAIVGALALVVMAGVTAFASSGSDDGAGTTGTMSTDPMTAPTATPSVDDDADADEIEDAGDVSGNCDEAEHATDPECTGAVASDEGSVGSSSDDIDTEDSDDQGEDSDDQGEDSHDSDETEDSHDDSQDDDSDDDAQEEDVSIQS